MAKEKIKYICSKCKKKFSLIYTAWYPTISCPKCQSVAHIVLEGDGTFNVGKGYREPTAFGYDRVTGRPLAMDKKGRTFDPSDTRYDLEHDRFGWGATGKIPKKKKIFI